MTEANTAATTAEAEVKVEEVVNDAAAKVEKTTTETDTSAGETKQTTDDKSQGDAKAETSGNTENDKPAALPDNWRELAAGEDEESLKLLKRYGSLNGVVKALVEKEKLIRSGKIKRDMPDPKDEKAMSEWRKDQGIPADATGYQLPETVTKRLVDEDKPILSSFTERMHGKNWTPQQVSEAAEWYVDLQETAAAERASKDNENTEAVEEELRTEWSRDEFKGNRTLAKRFWDSTGINDLSEARMPDGRRLGDLKEFIMFSSDRGREMFGDVVFASADAESRHASRKAEIEGIMKTDINRYWTEGLDKEMAQILAKEEKRK